MTGAIMSQTRVGIAGFVIMLGSAYVALTSWRGQSAVDEAQVSGLHEPFTLIEGGRSRKRGGRGRSRQHHSRQHQSMMERFEERWRRRRDQQNGF
jgi:hypothetical protein